MKKVLSNETKNYQIKNSPECNPASTFYSILMKSLVIQLVILGVYLDCVIDHRNKKYKRKRFEYLNRAKDTQDLFKAILYLLNNANKRWFTLKKCIKGNYSKEKFTTKVPLKSDHCCPQHALSLPRFWPHFFLLSQILLFLLWCINHSSFHLIRKKKVCKSQFTLITFHYYYFSRLSSSLSKTVSQFTSIFRF